MRTLLGYGAVMLAAVAALGLPVRAEGPELTYSASAAQGGLLEEHRRQIDAYVKYWTDALAAAGEADRVIEACNRLLEGYNKYGSQAAEHQDAFAEMLAKHGRTLLGKIAADDPLAALKEVNFALRLGRMVRQPLQPLAETMVAHRNAGVRFLGWRLYGALRPTLLASGGAGAKALFAGLGRAAAESDPYVLGELLAVCRMPARPDPAWGVDEAAYTAAQGEALKALATSWNGICRKVMAADAAAVEAGSAAVRALRLLKTGLGDGAEDKQVLQLAANMAYAAGQAYDRAVQMESALAGAEKALGPGAPEDADLTAAETLAAKFGRTAAQLLEAKSEIEQAVSACEALLNDCEVALNIFTGKGEPGERHIRKELKSRAPAEAKGAAVRLAVLKWVGELQKDHGIKAPSDELKKAPATAPAG